MDDKYARLIESELCSSVSGTLERMKGGDNGIRPFHNVLLPSQVVFWSRFERSFSTSFGEKTIEKISEYAVLNNGATESKRQKETAIEIDSRQSAAIDGIIKKNRNKQFTNWSKSYQMVLSTPKSGKLVTERVISDLWWVKDGVNNYVSIKTVKPNIDQTAVAKSDCLRLKTFDPGCNAYFGLYYNPFGSKRSDYQHNPASTMFDMLNDPVVLIGEDYWDLLGGEGFYLDLLDIVDKVGVETREMIDDYQEGFEDYEGSP